MVAIVVVQHHNNRLLLRRQARMDDHWCLLDMLAGGVIIHPPTERTRRRKKCLGEVLREKGRQALPGEVSELLVVRREAHRLRGVGGGGRAGRGGGRLLAAPGDRGRPAARTRGAERSGSGRAPSLRRGAPEQASLLDGEENNFSSAAPWARAPSGAPRRTGTVPGSRSRRRGRRLRREEM